MIMLEKINDFVLKNRQAKNIIVGKCKCDSN